jgi:hypothetical protein
MIEVPPMKPKSAYHVRKPDGSIEGPFSSQDLRSRARAGLIDGRDVVQREGESVWVRAAKVGGIREILFASALDRAAEATTTATTESTTISRPVEIPKATPPASRTDAPSLDDTVADLTAAPDDAPRSSARGAVTDIALDETPLAPLRFDLSNLEGSGLLSLEEEGPPPAPIVVPRPPAPRVAPPLPPPPPAPRSSASSVPPPPPPPRRPG